MGYGHAKGQPWVPAYTPFVAAGFFAAPAEVLRDAPFDPFVPWVFMGEEVIRG